MDVALDKTIQEFKMWGSMSRKPGQPADYLREIYANLLGEQQTVPLKDEKHPEILAERLWESFLKMLLQKDYHFHAGFYGSLNEFSRKVAYFFHASLQGTACYPGVVAALRYVKESGLVRGLVADTQCFTLVQLERGLVRQDATAKLTELIDLELCACSHEFGARKPSERLFRHALGALSKRDISAEQVLHIGSRVVCDVIPARRVGMKTGLFAGDKASLQATREQMKDPATRPDVLLTDLSQIADVIG
jgi:FMN phosphatase YigB (HAD superfamily)